jgi:hypothetical protein
MYGSDVSNVAKFLVTIEEMWEKRVNPSMTTDGVPLTIISTNLNKRFNNKSSCYKNFTLRLNKVQKYSGYSVCKETARNG